VSYVRRIFVVSTVNPKSRFGNCAFGAVSKESIAIASAVNVKQRLVPINNIIGISQKMVKSIIIIAIE
jgi:hypothetical protein